MRDLAAAAVDPFARLDANNVAFIHIAEHDWTETLPSPFLSQFSKANCNEAQVVDLVDKALARRRGFVHTYEGGWACFWKAPAPIGRYYDARTERYEETPVLKGVVNDTWDKVLTAYPVLPFGPYRD